MAGSSQSVAKWDVDKTCQLLIARQWKHVLDTCLLYYILGNCCCCCCCAALLTCDVCLDLSWYSRPAILVPIGIDCVRGAP